MKQESIENADVNEYPYVKDLKISLCLYGRSYFPYLSGIMLQEVT